MPPSNPRNPDGFQAKPKGFEMSKKGIPRIKDPEESRSEFCQIRMTKSEKADLKKKANSVSMKLSEFLRKSIKSTQVWTARDKKIESEKIRQLARIGNNLNQISRWCNQNKSGADALEVSKNLMAIEHELKKVFQ